MANIRILPVSSKSDLLQFVDEIKSYPNPADRDAFVAYFGSAYENWYYQEVDGKPVVIVETLGTDAEIEEGFRQYQDLDQPFFNWFRNRILELTGIDMRAIPGGNGSEHVFEFGK